jgi:DNA-binding NtrC family response regulator
MPNADTNHDRLLIVEDDAAQRTGMQKLLTSWGFNVDVAKDGREALDMVARSRPSIVLSDMVMPNMGGLELLRALKQDDADVTMVLLTAQGSVETAVEAISTGRTTT